MYSIKYYLRYIKSKVLWETIYDKFFIQETIKKIFYKFKETYYINEKDSYKLFKF